MDMKEIEKECLVRGGELSEYKQRTKSLEKRLEKVENGLGRVTAYFIITLLGIIGFFIKLYMTGGVKK